MKVVVGLGNPGSQYAGTRHNVGWLVMDRLAERAGWTGKGRQRDASNVAMGRFRGLDLTLVKPLTYMNNSGLAVRKVIAREHAPLSDLLVVADDFALPFGKLRFREGGGAGGHNGLGSIIDELGTEKFSRLRIGIGEPDRNAVDHVLTRFAPDEQQRLDELLDAAADAVEAWAREGTNKAANRFNMFELRPADQTRLAAAGRGRRPARRRRHPPDAHRLAAPPPGQAGRLSRAGHPAPWPTRPRPPDRRTRRDRLRRAPCAAAARGRARLRHRRGRCRGRGRAARGRTGGARPTAQTATRRSPRPAARPRPATPARPGGGHRLPDLSGLPPLLAATGTFAALRERLGRTDDDPRRTGRHVGLVAVPHGAKSYLAAALALAPAGERLVWIARDAEIGDRVAEELGAWLGDVDAVAVLEPRTALAYERSELIADETAARVAALASWRSGRARILVASVQALLQHTIDPADLPAAPRELRLGSRVHQDALLRELFDLGYVPVSEVAGRGESARRGGIVDVFPPSMALPIRIEFFGDEIDSLRSFDPTDQRTVGTLESAVLLPASEFLLPAGGAAAIRDRLGRAAARLPERLAADLERFDAPRARHRTRHRPRPRESGDGGRRRGGGLGRPPRPGDRARPHRPWHAPAPRRAR